MTVISSIIADAYRESNTIPLGRDPTTNQVTEGLRLLNALFSACFGDEAGESLQDWDLGNFGREHEDTSLTDYQRARPNINRRLIAINEEAFTVYLSPWPQDGSRMGIIDPFGRLATYPVTLDGNSRTIDGASTALLDTNGLNKEWFYRADLGDWVTLTSKAETDEMPFPTDFDNFWMIMLAMRINPRYGRQLDPLSETVWKSERQKFISRYLQSQPLEIDDSISWPFMSQQSYDQQRQFSSTDYFNRGYQRGG